MDKSYERDQIKKDISKKVILGSKWFPLSMEWFERWRIYVDFDNTDKNPVVHPERHPGPIDNSSLQGTYKEELKKELVENRDYVLLSDVGFNLLLKEYGGGPIFPREACNMGTPYSPINQVNLYPIRIEVYHCDETYKEPDRNNSNRFLVQYFAKNTDFEKVSNTLRTLFKIPHSKFRFWLKDGEFSETSDPSGMDSSDTGPSTRYLTSDVTDLDGPWRLFRPNNNMNIRAMMGNNECIELILESTERFHPDETMWPRYSKLQQWKERLRPGDHLDVKDHHGTWYVGVVKSVLSDKPGVAVHYLGWDDKFDEEVEDMNSFKPLFTETPNRYNWSENDLIEMKISAPGLNSLWLQATIVEIDKATERIKVTFPKSEQLKLVKKYWGEEKSSAWENALNDEIEESGDENMKFKWYPLFSNDICHIYTHLKKQGKDKKPATGMIPNIVSTTKKISNIPYNVLSSITNSGSSYSQSSSTSSALTVVPSRGSYYSSYDYMEKHVRGTPDAPGVVGLQNLGNTCFMNSILQCLSNTQAITDYFLKEDYKSQINRNNPLGHKGKIVEEYAEIIKCMWSGLYTKVVPRDFKTTIGEFQPQFAGYDQQDSQEFLGFLLDGLHEDLNRIVNKPMTTKIESNGRDDELIASEAWRRYLMRNDSPLVDKCFGLLKSHVTCMNCKNVSVTFDPYSSLSLPIPLKTTRTIPVLIQLFPHPMEPVLLDVEVEVNSTMKDFKRIMIDHLIEYRLLQPIYTTSLLSKPVVCESPTTSEKGSSVNTSDTYEMVEMPETDNAKFDTHGLERKLKVPRKDVETNGKGCETSVPMTIDEFDVIEHTSVEETVEETMAQITTDTSHVMTIESEFSLPTVPPDVMDSEHPPKIELANSSSDMKIDYSKYFFHFCIAFQSRSTNIWKNFEDDLSTTLVTQFVGKTDHLLAMELEYNAPVHKVQTSYSYHYYQNNSQSRTEPEEVSPYMAVDVLFGWIVTSHYTMYGSNEKIELEDYPNRISFPKKCSGRFIHEKIWNMMKRYVPETSSYHQSAEQLTDLPYDLLVTNSYGNNRKFTVLVSDEEVVIPGGDALCVLWKTEAKGDDHLDAEEIRKVKDISKMYQSSSSFIAAPSNTRLSIYKCLDKYIEREQLLETEAFYCSKCKQHLAPLKKMDVWSAPDVLIVHLKRFQYVPGQYFVHREKITDLIDFPIENLDLSRYVIGPQSHNAPPIYDLYAVSHHSGGLGGGHYTATCSNFQNEKWYNFNDSSVHETSATESVSPSSYVLFYKRKQGKLKWAGVVPTLNPIPDEEK